MSFFKDLNLETAKVKDLPTKEGFAVVQENVFAINYLSLKFMKDEERKKLAYERLVELGKKIKEDFDEISVLFFKL